MKKREIKKNKMSSGRKENRKSINSKKNLFGFSKNDSNFVKFKKFWKFIFYDDSILSYVLNFILAFIFIKYILFPGFGLVLNTSYPIVAIVSGSMQHKIVEHRICDDYVMNTYDMSLNLSQWWHFCSNYYVKNFNITKSNFTHFEYKNGLNIGDVMVLYGKNPKDIKVGDVIVFIPEDKRFFEQMGPVIHRVVKKWKTSDGKYHFQTKGDHNPKSFENFETNIPQKNILGVPILRIPYIGYVKLLVYKAYVFMKN